METWTPPSFHLWLVRGYAVSACLAAFYTVLVKCTSLVGAWQPGKTIKLSKGKGSRFQKDSSEENKQDLQVLRIGMTIYLSLLLGI